MRLMSFVSTCSGTSSWANSISWKSGLYYIYIYIRINLSTNVRGILSEENRIRLHAKKKIWGAAKTSKKYLSQRNQQSSKRPTGCCELHIGQNGWWPLFRPAPAHRLGLTFSPGRAGFIIYIYIRIFIYIYINLSTNVRGILSEENRIRIHAQIDLGAAKTIQKYPSQRNDQSSKQHTGCCELHIGQSAANVLCFDLLGQIALG